METDYKAIRSKIFHWLKNHLNDEAIQWVESTSEMLKKDPEDWELYTSFSSVPRYTGKNEIQFSEEELKQADSLRKGWNPSTWRTDQLTRTFFILSFAEQGEKEFLDKIEKIVLTSDLGEAVALYQALPVYPFPEKFKDRAAEGVRSNITTVFNAVALDNPYPAEYLDELAWNQIVLKALFVGSPLYRIYGIDDRANRTLAKMLVDYAHERWAANRYVSPELWRPVGPFLDEEFEEEIKRVLNQSEKIQKQAAVLALQNSSYSRKNELLESHQTVVREISENSIGWDDIGKEFEETK